MATRRNRDDISRGHPLGLPYWLKIERRGDLLNTYTSLDGTSWAAALSCYYANLPATLHIGLFVNSGSTTAAPFVHGMRWAAPAGIIPSLVVPFALAKNTPRHPMAVIVALFVIITLIGAPLTV